MTWSQIGSSLYGDNSNDQFGKNIDISADGSVLAVGARQNNNNTGKVKLFFKVNDEWVQYNTAPDISGSSQGDLLGSDVALSSDGTVLAVGAPGGDYVKVYKIIENTTVLIGEFDDNNTITNSFGTSLDLSDDGSILAIGEPGYPDSYSRAGGRVRVYKNINGSWTQTTRSPGYNWAGATDDLIVGNSYDSTQEAGFHLSLSGDGSKLAVSQHGPQGSYNQLGAYRLYNIDTTNNIWSPNGNLIQGKRARLGKRDNALQI